jgi:hypothetical protein
LFVLVLIWNKYSVKKMMLYVYADNREIINIYLGDSRVFIPLIFYHFASIKELEKHSILITSIKIKYSLLIR